MRCHKHGPLSMLGFCSRQLIPPTASCSARYVAEMNDNMDKLETVGPVSKFVLPVRACALLPYTAARPTLTHRTLMHTNTDRRAWQARVDLG